MESSASETMLRRGQNYPMSVKRTIRRVAYYGRGIWRYVSSPRRYRRELREASALMHLGGVRERVDYYCKIAPQGPAPVIRPQGKLRDVGLVGRSRYALDLFAATSGLERDFSIDVLFGDITHVPSAPSIVKSRPIDGENGNSVILPLNRLRHFNFPKDPYRLNEKEGSAVWRGALNNPTRIMAVQKYGPRVDHNIGHTSEESDHPFLKPRLGLMDHYRHRYILSLEGNDVATNLKWVMASNSAAVCPPLRYETWFMEGKLAPHVHYIGLEPDLSDLDEKIGWYEARPDALARVVKAAHDWVDTFRNWPREEAIARAVILKYAALSGQTPDWLEA